MLHLPSSFICFIEQSHPLWLATNGIIIIPSRSCATWVFEVERRCRVFVILGEIDKNFVFLGSAWSWRRANNTIFVLCFGKFPISFEIFQFLTESFSFSGKTFNLSENLSISQTFKPKWGRKLCQMLYFVKNVTQNRDGTRLLSKMIRKFALKSGTPDLI